MESWTDRVPDTALGPTRRSTGDRLHPALDAVVQVLDAQAVSLDRLRRAVVRYGALAREQALQLEEMLVTLRRGVRGVLDTLPDARRTEVLAFVQWWAMHGYHRVD
jgi:hypothetical protein